MSEKRGEREKRVNGPAWGHRTIEYAMLVHNRSEDAYYVELHGGMEGPYPDLVEVLNEVGSMGWHITELIHPISDDISTQRFLLSRRRS